MENTTFTSREFNKKLSELSKEEFISMFMEDIEVAKIEYRKYSDRLAKERYEKEKKSWEENQERKIQKIIKMSFENYKREYYRVRWVEQEIAKLPKTFEETWGMFQKSYYKGYDLTSISWDIKPWENGSSLIPLDIETERIKNILGKHFDEGLNNKYFSNATGWDINKNGLKLHLSPELEADWKEDFRKLAEEIQRFYADCRYCGD